MFSYNSADITYAVIFGKGDCSSDIDYSVDLNKKEAKIYTKARMLGQNLNGVMDTDRIKRDIVRYEKYEYGTDISRASVSISFCGNQEQPLVDDVKEYLRDLLASHRVTFAHEVVEAQINIFEDTDNDWNQIALDFAMEVNCPGYAKKYQEGKFNQVVWEKEREKYLNLHPELNKIDESKLCGKNVRNSKKLFIRQRYKDPVWFRMWPDMTYMFDGQNGLANSAIVNRVKPKRLRGCQLLGSPFDTNPYILTKSGKKVRVNTSGFFEPYFYGAGLCPYNAEPNMFSIRNMPDGGAYYGHRNLHPGKWGFIDMEGNVVIEPQYVYALGAFGPEDKEFFVVARLINKKVYWGILDYNGNESIPCKYVSIKHEGSSDIVIYQEDVDGLFGLMKIDGTVILPPTFGHIFYCHFCPEDIFVIAGKDEDYDGIFSLEKKKYVVPPRADSLSWSTNFLDETKTIKLVRTRDSEVICYDYDGNLIK